MTAPQAAAQTSTVLYGLTLLAAVVGTIGILAVGGDTGLVIIFLGAIGLQSVGTAAQAITNRTTHQLQQTTTEKVDQLQQAVGPANGESLTELMKRVAQLLEQQAALDKYTHQRNHDILAELAKLTIAMPLLIELAQQLHDELPAKATRTKASGRPRGDG